MPMYTGAPRVRVVEKDLSTVPNNTPAFPNTTVGIIGCGLKGPIGYPVRLQSPTQLQNIFGLPNTQTNKSLIYAATILNAGGNVQFVNVPRGQYYRHLVVTYTNGAFNALNHDLADAFTFDYIGAGISAVKLEPVGGEFTYSQLDKLSKAKDGKPFGVDFNDTDLGLQKSIGFVSRAAGSSQDAEWKLTRFEPAVAQAIIESDEDDFRTDNGAQTVLNKINAWARQFAVSGYLKNLNQLIRVTFAMVQNPEVTETVVFSVSANPLMHTINGISYDIQDAFANSSIYAESVGFLDTDVIKFDLVSEPEYIEAAKVNIPFLFEKIEFTSDEGTVGLVTSTSLTSIKTVTTKTITSPTSTSIPASAEYVVNAESVDGDSEDELVIESAFYDYFFGDVEQLKVDIVIPVLKSDTTDTLVTRTNVINNICNSKLKKIPANVTLGLINGTMSDSGADFTYIAKGATDADGNKVPKVTSTGMSVDSGFAYYFGEITVRNFLGRIPVVKLPLNVVAAAVMCFNDFKTGTYAPWLAPMGVDGGSIDAVIPGVVVTSDAVQQKVADALYDARINFIKNIPGYGNVIMGQKTAQLQATALNRINVRRLVNYIKYIIYRISFPYIGRLNTVQQRANLSQEIIDFMDRVKFNDGVYAYRLILDDSNNTPDVIDNNGLVAELKIQPTKVIEYIDPITITITRTGVTL